MIPAVLSDFGNKNFAAFWTYWDELPKTGFVPQLQDYFSNAPPKLQPGMLILDVHSEGEISVRLAGTAVVDAVGELTGSDEDSVYSPETRLQMIGRSWTAVNTPCGYFHNRQVRNVDGLAIISPGMGLPVTTGNNGLKTIMVFNDTPRAEDPIAIAETDGVVQTFGQVSWIDIGAGVPGDS